MGTHCFLILQPQVGIVEQTNNTDLPPTTRLFYCPRIHYQHYDATSGPEMSTHLAVCDGTAVVGGGRPIRSGQCVDMRTLNRGSKYLIAPRQAYTIKHQKASEYALEALSASLYRYTMFNMLCLFDD